MGKDCITPNGPNQSSLNLEPAYPEGREKERGRHSCYWG